MSLTYIRHLVLIGTVLFPQCDEAPDVRYRVPVLTELLNLHNLYRSFENSANMGLLIWDAQLASMAAIWVAQCQQVAAREDPAYEGIEQAFYVHHDSLYPNFGEAVYSWYKEKEYYNFKRAKCAHHKLCHRYTQIIWAKTRRIGCSYRYCDPLPGCMTPGSSISMCKGVLLLCNYEPKQESRWSGVQPYVSGMPCSKCDNGAGWCRNKLCDWRCTDASFPHKDCQCRAICRNCGKLDSKTCTCSCADGWTGIDCSEVCRSASDDCKIMWEQPAPDTCPPVFAERIQRQKEYEEYIANDRDKQKHSAAVGINVQSTQTMFTGQHSMVIILPAFLVLNSVLRVQ